jgi:hypothetical protein
MTSLYPKIETLIQKLLDTNEGIVADYHTLKFSKTGNEAKGYGKTIIEKFNRDWVIDGYYLQTYIEVAKNGDDDQTIEYGIMLTASTNLWHQKDAIEHACYIYPTNEVDEQILLSKLVYQLLDRYEKFAESL